MKTKLTLALALLVAPLALGAAPEASSPPNRYKTLAPAVSTLEEAKRALGEIERTETVPGGFNYHFKGVTLNFSGKDKIRINTIIIWGDLAYKNSKGLGVGDAVEKIKAANPEATVSDNIYSDMGNGVIYWTDGSKIVRMVLCARR